MGCGPSSIQSPEEETIEKPKNSVPPTHAKSKSNSTTPVQKSVSTTTPTTSTKPAATHHVPIEKQVQSPKNTHGPHPTRKSSINTPNLQTVKETKTPGDEAFSEQETHSLHRKHSHRSSQYHSVDSTALSNSSVDKSKDLYSPIKFDMEKFRKANSDQMWSSERLQERQERGSVVGIKSRRSSEIQIQNLDETDEFLMDDILSSAI